MKKITLLLILLTVSFGYSQTVIEDFQADLPVGALTMKDGLTASVVVVDNETAPTGLDLPASPGERALKLVTSDGPGSAPWQQGELLVQGSPINLVPGNYTITMDVYSDIQFDILAKVVKSGGGEAETPQSYTTAGQWQTLTFDFSTTPANGIYEQIIFLPLWNSSGINGDPRDQNWNLVANNISYIDNIQAPETCFDGIMNQTETGIDCGGTCAVCDIIAPTGFTANVGAIGATTVELLLKATDEASVNITYNITGSATEQTTGPSGVEKSFIITGLNPSTTYSFNVSASDMTGNPAVNNPQIVGATTIAVPAPSASAPASTTLDSDVLFLYSDVYTTTEVSFLDPAWAAIPPSNYSGPSTELVIAATSDNVRYFENANVLFMNIPETDVTAYDYFHIDIWSANSSFAIVKWVANGPGIEGNIPVTLTPNTWNSVDIDLDTFGAFSTAANRATMFQLIIDAAGGNDYYFDNVYFSKTPFTLGAKDFDLDSFSLFPNPTQDSWTLKTKIENIASINVFDILGKSVLSLSPNTSEATIDGSNLKSGLYFAQVKTANGISTLKLVKK